MLASWRKSYHQPRQHIKKQRHYFANKGPSSQSHGFSSSHAHIWELYIKEAECWRTDAFELWCCRRLLRVSWTTGRSNQSILKESISEYSLEGLMLKQKLQYFATWCKELSHWKNPDSVKDWRQEEKGTTEDEMAGWHHQLNECELEWTPGVGDGQGGLACCDSWGHEESDMTERLIWSDLISLVSLNFS